MNGDMERLIKAMNDFKNGIFSNIDTSEFDDPAVAEIFNEMVNAQIARNNHYLARINDAQLRIGDTSCLKSMFEQISDQQEVINKIIESRASLEIRESSLLETNGEFLALAMQIKNSFEACNDEIRKANDIADSIRIPSPDSGAGMANADLWQAVAMLKDIVNQSYERIGGMEKRITSMSEDAYNLFDVIDRKAKMNNSFLEDVDALTDSYKKLSTECLDMGRHLYRISRDIDNARNDMFRHNTRPTIHDMLRVFEVDHLTLSWRLYNNIVEFESLKLSQVNNPNTCKFGLWIQSVDNPVIRDAEPFMLLVQKHLELHEKSVECFEAKQNYDIPLALIKFNETLGKLAEFRAAMDEMHIYLRSIGDTAETDVWTFRG